MKKRLLFIGALCTTALGGCSATHLAYVHNANLGVDLGASAKEGQVKLAVGFDRKTYAIVPRKKQDETSDAMSLTSASRVEVQGLSLVRFGHVVATGNPAIGLAKDPKNFGDIVNKFFEEKPESQEGK